MTDTDDRFEDASPPLAGSKPKSATANELLCSQAMERLAHALGVTVDLDDPEQALIAAVDRRVRDLIKGC